MSACLSSTLRAALAFMAGLLTLVLATGQVTQAWPAARQAFQKTGYSPAFLVVAKTPFFSECGTRRTGCVTVACVGNRVSTRVFPGTWLPTLRRPCSAGDGRTQCCVATVAAQVLKADVPARRAISPVARFFTDMLSARKTLAAHKWAAVLNVHTAQGKALVAATLASLLTSPLTQFRRLPLWRRKLYTGKLT